MKNKQYSDTERAGANRRTGSPAGFAVALVVAAGVLAGVALGPWAGRTRAVLAGSPGMPATASQMPPSERYPYQGEAFTRFVAESFGPSRPDGPRTFYRWMDAHFGASASGDRTWTAWMADARRSLSGIKDPARKAKAERDLAAAVHKRIKATIPRFSLDRGFEFTNTVRYGERQCFLQSVLIAGLLQSAGMDAGTVMVNGNPEGQSSNNGHAVVLARLADGRDILVDASEPKPFPEHTGLFVWDARAKDYRYVSPAYASGSPVILGYHARATGRDVANRDVRTLSIPFLRSQFEYYRGERAPGGFMAKPQTAAGLKDSARHLRASIQMCPGNPLPHSVLMHVEASLGNRTAGDRERGTARGMYARYGWLPPSLKEQTARS